VFIVLDII